ncbi:hypothetical protein C5E05_19260 [Pseudoclavibacter sp. AY1H1]|nr:hypothetical protein C5E05_19260 [Pseudoclavibacter sp. AY1H1]
MGADKGDESRSIEWKSGYANILSADASFAIARAILGLANRPVDVAASAFEGVGYVVVGAEPGTLLGQVVPDSAEVLNALRRYTGHGSPLWDQRLVDVEGTEVLVITVEPPRVGDRIALLQKGFQPAKGPLIAEGTIFVRQPGATERGSRSEIEMLQDRLLAGANTAERERVSKRNEQIRDAVVECVAAAHRWSRAIEIMVLMTYKRAWQARDWEEWVETDTGRAMAADQKLLTDSARRLRLLVSDETFLSTLKYAIDCVNAPDRFEALIKKEVTDEIRSATLQNVWKTQEAWDAVEAAAIAVVSDK